MMFPGCSLECKQQTKTWRGAEGPVAYGLWSMVHSGGWQ